MGKGQIISGGTGGEYQVKVLYNRDRYDAMIVDLNTKKTKLEENRIPVQSERDDKSAEVDVAISELNVLIDELADLYISLENSQVQLAALRNQLTILEQELEDLQNQVPPASPGSIAAKQQQIVDKQTAISNKQTDISDTEKEIDEKQTEVEEKQLEANTLTFELAILDQKLAEIDLQITSIEKKIQYLEENMPADETVSAWCADLTEDLSGYVGTVEIPGERIGDYGGLQIQPGYEDNAVYDSDRDGQLFPTIAVTAAQAFYNAAMLPGWQKWKPLFRHGTITAIANSLASVTLDATVLSSQQDLAINQAATLTGVAFEYMSCDGSAFTVDDEVLIMFTGQDFAHPKIIGFKTDPQTCCLYKESFTDGSYDLAWPVLSGGGWVSFEERVTFDDPWEQYYLYVESETSTIQMRDLYNFYEFVGNWWESDVLLCNHNDVTLTVSMDNIDFTYDETASHITVSVYGKYVDSDRGLLQFRIFPNDTIPPDIIFENNDGDLHYYPQILLSEADLYSVDLSETFYNGFLRGGISGVAVEFRNVNVDFNMVKFCANSGDPISPISADDLKSGYPVDTLPVH